ncbi:MAG: stage IV sporulation protein A [Clostridiales bacterium]|nr:stage IV sporulation protein A [Clostridiales bacterium]
MLGYDIYDDIALRTGGDIYLGVVGPVRTGKSTFIKRFMELLVLDKITDKNKLARAIDELPQSADGKTIMTTEPKFVPNEAIPVTFDRMTANVRLIDCVGYMVEDALGQMEGGKSRLVKTPWLNEEVTFQQAAEIGTTKVIKEHSTVGILVTTDGTITEIAREKYVASEERVINELKHLGKPFAIVLNSRKPTSKEAKALKQSIEKKHNVPVILCDVLNLTKDTLYEIMHNILFQFPITSIKINVPRWMRTLGINNKIIASIIAALKAKGQDASKMCDFEKMLDMFVNSEYIESDIDLSIDASNGEILITCKAKEGLYFKVLSEECNNNIDDDYKLLAFVKKLSQSYADYESIRKAMESVKSDGYGVVNPNVEDMQLEEPELVKKGGQYGVKLKASAPSFHIVRVDVQTELSPVIGSEQQSEDLVKYLLSEFETNKQGIWDTNMFGKSLNSLVKEDLNNKLNNMPIDAQNKLRKTISRIVNEGKGGVLCILL